jgi:serine/threonine-protein kinase
MFLLAFALGALPGVASAESDAASRALAVQLFDEAEALFAKGSVAEACPKYAESYRLDPQLGALIYLAECYEKNGQLASAWGSFREAEELAQKRGDPRAPQARARAVALEAKLDYLVVRVSSDARVPGLEVLRDGRPVAPVLWGSRAAIDPGKHQLVARAPGYVEWKRDIDVAAGSKEQTVEIPKLTAAPQSSTGALASASSANTGQRIAALAVGGLGIVGLGVSGVLGLSAQASYSDSEELCNADNYCTQRGVELRESAQGKALGASIAAGVGVAALTTAAVLWFTAKDTETPPSKAAAPPRRLWAVAPSANSWGLDVTGQF